MLLVGLGVLTAACGGSGDGPRTTAAPTAVISATPDGGRAPLQVVLDGRSSRAGEHPLTDFAWQLGAGADPAVGAVVSHTFTEAGNHDVVLTVTDAAGRSATAQATISVDPASGRFTLSGRIRVLASTAVDSDVNDPQTSPIPNNDFSQAQPLPNPVTLGGYVNVPGAGRAGHLQESGDPGDFFQVQLTAQDAVLLTVADRSADLAMNLWHDPPADEPVDSVMVNGGAGLLRVPDDGVYFIEVWANAGASNYVLNIGPDLALTVAEAAAAERSARLSDDFVAGEWIETGASGSAMPARLRRLDDGESRARGTDRAAMQALLRQRGTGLQRGRVSPRAWHKLETLAAIQRHNRQRRDALAEPNYIRRPAAETDDPFLRHQWHYPAIELPAAWSLTKGSTDVIVAVIDTGVLLDHPDLRNAPGAPEKLVQGRNFISDPARSGGDIDPEDPNDPGDQALRGRSSFHGTHVAGTIGARTDNGIGVAGVGWHTRIMPLRVLGVGGGTSFDMIQAVRYAAGLDNASGALPDAPAHIINLSLGSRSSSLAERNALQAARDAGLIIIAAAGNQASSQPFFPASYPGVVSVSATTITGSLAPYSNFGPGIDLAAPGGNNQTDINGDGIGDGVVSTAGDDSGGTVRFGYSALNGTSMAAPHVAGVAALMKAVHPALTPDQFDALLQSGALTDDLGLPGRDDQFGHGQINARKAVIAALDLVQGGGGEVGPLLSGSTSIVNLGPFQNEFEVTVRNVGGGTLEVASVQTNQPWLTARPPPGDGQSLGTWRFEVDRDALGADATHHATATFLSTANDFRVSVVVQQRVLDPSADAGLHHVALVDVGVDPPRTVPGVGTRATAIGGEYHFQLVNVPPGQYRLFAGTDHNNDGFICDGGEACGAYRTLDAPEIIVVNRSRGDLDFTSGFPGHLFNPEAAQDAGGIGVRVEPQAETAIERPQPTEEMAR